MTNTNITPAMHNNIRNAVKFRVLRSKDYVDLRHCISEHAVMVEKRNYKKMSIRDIAIEYGHRGMRPSHGADLYVAWALCKDSNQMKNALSVRWERITPYEDELRHTWDMLELHYLKLLEANDGTQPIH